MLSLQVIFTAAGILTLAFGIIAIFAARMPQDEIAHPLEDWTGARSPRSRSRRPPEGIRGPGARPAGLPRGPAFFVLRIPWLGWVLLAAGMLVAYLVRGRTDAEAEAARASVSTAPDAAPDAHPSLVRDLSLIVAC